jgi:hypothetical protein
MIHLIIRLCGKRFVTELVHTCLLYRNTSNMWVLSHTGPTSSGPRLYRLLVLALYLDFRLCPSTFHLTRNMDSDSTFPLQRVRSLLRRLSTSSQSRSSFRNHPSLPAEQDKIHLRLKHGPTFSLNPSIPIRYLFNESKKSFRSSSISRTQMIFRQPPPSNLFKTPFRSFDVEETFLEMRKPTSESDSLSCPHRLKFKRTVSFS